VVSSLVQVRLEKLSEENLDVIVKGSACNIDKLAVEIVNIGESLPPSLYDWL